MQKISIERKIAKADLYLLKKYMFSSEYLTITLLRTEKIFNDIEISLLYEKEVLKEIDLGNFFPHTRIF
ncbi:MAG: hypothetical protein ACP5I7_04945 [Sulfolobales archaeon]